MQLHRNDKIKLPYFQITWYNTKKLENQNKSNLNDKRIRQVPRKIEEKTQFPIATSKDKHSETNLARSNQNL